MSGKRLSRWSKPSRWDRQETSFRNDAADDDRTSRKGPAGLIFMCNSNTKRECFHYKVFGLPLAKRDLVEQVVPGTLLFLFNFDVKELYGIYEAVSRGGMNLEPKAFQGQGSYPAQVRFDIHRECLPLSEEMFKDAIRENYYARNKFNFELTADQVAKLIELFCPIEPPRKRINIGNAPSELHQADNLRQGLLEKSNPLPARVELVSRDSQYGLPPPALRMEGRPPGHAPQFSRDSQYGLPPQALRMEERPPGHAPQFRLEPRPLVVDAVDNPRLPQIKVLEGRSDQTGLLNQGRMEEVDRLALKYLQQANPTVGSGLDPYSRRTALPLAEGVAPSIGLVSSLQQDAVFRGGAFEAERLRGVGSNRMAFRDQGLHSAVAAAGSLMQSAGHSAIRRRA